VFFAIAQSAGALGPLLYGFLIGDGSHRAGLTVGYLIGAALMVAGGLTAAALGVNAERRSLESIARPLSAVGPAPTLPDEENVMVRRTMWAVGLVAACLLAVIGLIVAPDVLLGAAALCAATAAAAVGLPSRWWRSPRWDMLTAWLSEAVPPPV
jgi:hypothetical protein